MNASTFQSPPFQTPGTHQRWSNFGDWMRISQYHFNAMPDGSHRRRPDREGAKRHMTALLETELIEQCADRSLLEKAAQFFNSLQHSNSSFRKSENPPELRNRIHNQIQRLKTGKPLPRTVTQAERELAKQTFVCNARVEGPNNRGIWQAGIILHVDRGFCVIRFDDDTFIQKPIVKLLQQGFTLSNAPAVELERILFEVSDQVRVKWWAEAKPATVIATSGNRVTVCDRWGRRTVHDAIELAFYFDGDHPNPHDFLHQLEATIRNSLEEMPLSASDREHKERQQERWIAQAECFAQAHSIHIDGSSDRWVLSLPKAIAPTATVVSVKHHPYTLYIGRANKTYKLPQSKWHNPYVVGKDGTLEEVLEKFLLHLLGSTDLMDCLEELDGEVLGCWCAAADTPLTIDAPLRCHGQILLRARRGDYAVPLATRKEQTQPEQLSLNLF